MPIKLECPRCKQSLAVPKKKAGGYVNCPRCKGRLWVPADAVHLAPSVDLPAAPNPSGASGVTPASESPAGFPPGPGSTFGGGPVAVPPTSSVSMRNMPSAGAPLPPASGFASAPSSLSPRGSSVSHPPGYPAAGALPTASWASSDAYPAPPPREKKVARLITAETAESTVKPAADGKLPELQLMEGEKAEKAEAKGTTVHPLVLVGVLCMSVAMSIMIVLVQPGTSDSGNTKKKVEARRSIESDYFSNFDIRSPLARYQLLLRDAQQCHVRGDRRGERDCYRQVLDLLKAERGPFEKGLTGSRERDRKLEEHITTLLGDY